MLIAVRICIFILRELRGSGDVTRLEHYAIARDLSAEIRSDVPFIHVLVSKNCIFEQSSCTVNCNINHKLEVMLTTISTQHNTLASTCQPVCSDE